MKSENLEAVKKDLSYYEGLPYTITVRKDEDGDFVAILQELPGCIAHGPNEASAIKELHSMKRLWIETALEAGDAIPEPEDEADLPSGKWLQRVPRTLHRELVGIAARENVSLNQLVTSMLAAAVAMRSCAQAINALPVGWHFLGHQPNPQEWSWSRQATEGWAIPSRVAKGRLAERLSQVKRLSRNEFRFDSPYADEHTGSEEYARK